MIKLYLDEDVYPALAQTLRARGYDVISAHEVNRCGLSDTAQLEFAAQEGRALVSFNAVDYIELNQRYWNENKTHAGIILSKQVALSLLIRQLGIFLQRNTREHLQKQLFWVRRSE